MTRTSMTRDQQERWAVAYLAGNLSRAETADAERSITVQAFADFFAAQWPKTFNTMAFAAKVRAVAQLPVSQGIGQSQQSPCPRCGTVHHPGYSCPSQERSVQMFDRLFTLPKGGSK
jgi:hypothetical protein